MAMGHRVDIDYSTTDMELNRRRLQCAYQFSYFDRVPVLLGIEARYLLRERGITFAEYFSDPKTQLIHQIENIKWRVENIPDDWFNEPKVTVSPDFQNVTNSSGCGCEIFWQENETPQSAPFLLTLDDMAHHELPDWRNTLWGKRLDWYYQMGEIAKDIEVRLSGERIPIEVNVGINGDSPFMAAVDMVGSNFYAWLHEAPEDCKQLLKKITDRYIEVETEYRKVSGKPLNDGIGYSDDSAQVISLDMYREFCVPVAKRLYDTFGCDRHDGRLMHLCGRNVHLHDALLNDLQITMLSGYGSENKPEEMTTLAGRVLLHGNVSPMTLYQGTPHDVEDETMHILEVLAPYGGVILGDGYNVAPETAISNLEAVKRTSEKYGEPKVSTRIEARADHVL
jgi:uroporphyrinogen-III decarboxylase